MFRFLLILLFLWHQILVALLFLRHQILVALASPLYQFRHLLLVPFPWWVFYSRIWSLQLELPQLMLWNFGTNYVLILINPKWTMWFQVSQTVFVLVLTLWLCLKSLQFKICLQRHFNLQWSTSICSQNLRKPRSRFCSLYLLFQTSISVASGLSLRSTNLEHDGLFWICLVR